MDPQNQQPPANQPPANQPPANQPPQNQQPPANQPPANQPPAPQTRPDADGYFTHADGQRRGFPEGVGWQDMTLQQQVAYWQNNSRRHENRASRANPDNIAELERKAQEFDALTAASQTDQQRAVADATERVRQEFLVREVEWAIRAAVGPRLTEEQLTSQLGPLNRSWFLTDGHVDTAKVQQYAATLQPTGHGNSGNPAANGYGYQPGARPSGRDAGIAEAERRFPTPARQN